MEGVAEDDRGEEAVEMEASEIKEPGQDKEDKVGAAPGEEEEIS